MNSILILIPIKLQRVCKIDAADADVAADSVAAEYAVKYSNVITEGEVANYCGNFIN